MQSHKSLQKIVDEVRPRELEEVVGQEKIIATIKTWIENRYMPNIICVGPPGSGKTTVVKILISKMFDGFDIWNKKHQDVLWLNASDERGIDVVRNEMLSFASQEPGTDEPFRILVLEEGDKLTKDAMDALRFPTEELSDRCRFIFLGNDLTYIRAIRSRCATFRFSALPLEEAKKYFLKVSKLYGVDIPEDIAEVVVAFYEGDMRAMFNDCLEKVRFFNRQIKLVDLDFTTDMKFIANELFKIITSNTPKKERYLQAKKYFTKKHAETRMDERQFIKILSDMSADMPFEVIEYFSTIDDRIRASDRNKEIHVSALIARMIDRGTSGDN